MPAKAPIKQAHVTRIMRGVLLSGARPSMVDVRPDGTIRFVFCDVDHDASKVEPEASAEGVNEWDVVLDSGARK